MYYDDFETVSKKCELIGDIVMSKFSEQNIDITIFGITIQLPLNAQTYDVIMNQGLLKMSDNWFPEQK